MDTVASDVAAGCAAEEVVACAAEDLPEAFLVSHGSFNPPHKGHVEMMWMAKQCVEAAGYQVTAGVLALTCTGHIAAKGAPVMTDEIREQCCNGLISTLGYGELQNNTQKNACTVS